MIPVIFSAGRGSRIGRETADLPKWFLEINDKNLYDYQLSALSEFFDEVYVVLGHGFTNRANINSILPEKDDLNIEPLIYYDWDSYENAGTANFAFEHIPANEDVLLICGDIIFNSEIMDQIVSEYNSYHKQKGYSAVTIIEGIQDKKTSVKLDKNDFITDYGRIKGHQEAGIFILNEIHRSEAVDIWKSNKNDWFPIVFPQVDSKAIRVADDDHFEVNTRSDLMDIRSIFTNNRK